MYLVFDCQRSSLQSAYFSLLLRWSERENHKFLEIIKNLNEESDISIPGRNRFHYIFVLEEKKKRILDISDHIPCHYLFCWLRIFSYFWRFATAHWIMLNIHTYLCSLHLSQLPSQPFLSTLWVWTQCCQLHHTWVELQLVPQLYVRTFLHSTLYVYEPHLAAFVGDGI